MKESGRVPEFPGLQSFVLADGQYPCRLHLLTCAGTQQRASTWHQISDKHLFTHILSVRSATNGPWFPMDLSFMSGLADVQ